METRRSLAYAASVLPARADSRTARGPLRAVPESRTRDAAPAHRGRAHPVGWVGVVAAGPSFTAVTTFLPLTLLTVIVRTPPGRLNVHALGSGLAAVFVQEPNTS